MKEKYPKLRDEDFDDFKDRSYESGVETLNLSKWKEFHLIKEKFIGYKYYFWRGQRKEKDWQLKSKFDRNSYGDGLASHFADREKILKALLEKFKEKLQGLKPPPNNIDFDSLEENVIWAIGQAYGLPTHFLDWTVNLYIAAYFAFFEKKTNKKCNRVIYSLNQAVQRRKFSEDRFVEFLDLIETCDATQNKRLKNQEGRFTKALNGIDIETNVRNYAKRCCDDIIENKKILLAKIFIPDEFRLECLTDLESLKITHGVLFPDYAGAVAICENDLDLNSLK